MVIKNIKKLKIVNAEEKGSVTYRELIPKREMVLTDSTKLVFSASESSQGKVNFDVRTYIVKESENIPTRKGINFNVENLEEFLAIIMDINKELIDKNI